MNISNGFQIENPRVFVPWRASEEVLVDLLGSFGLKKVTAGYYTISTTSLCGLECEIGFHFTPRHGGALHELEFFRKSYQDQAKSFEEFQRHLEGTFGIPDKISKCMEGFPQFEWSIGNRVVVHYIFDRFGPEEHVRIR
jgi:hypothetical protein